MGQGRSQFSDEELQDYQVKMSTLHFVHPNNAHNWLAIIAAFHTKESFSTIVLTAVLLIFQDLTYFTKKEVLKYEYYKFKNKHTHTALSNKRYVIEIFLSCFVGPTKSSRR